MTLVCSLKRSLASSSMLQTRMATPLTQVVKPRTEKVRSLFSIKADLDALLVLAPGEQPYRERVSGTVIGDPAALCLSIYRLGGVDRLLGHGRGLHHHWPNNAVINDHTGLIKWSYRVNCIRKTKIKKIVRVLTAACTNRKMDKSK